MPSKHTPGPWDFVAEDGQGCTVYTESASPLPVKQHNADDVAQIEWRGGYEESISNARLIAAAPRMATALLAAAQALRSYQNGNTATDLAEHTADFAEEVLAEAEGGPDAS